MTAVSNYNHYVVIVVSLMLCHLLSGDNSSSYGDSLRRILEDYLEIDPHSNSAISQLLSPSLLGKYFKRVIYASRDLIFDIDQAADEVLCRS